MEKDDIVKYIGETDYELTKGKCYTVQGVNIHDDVEYLAIMDHCCTHSYKSSDFAQIGKRKSEGEIRDIFLSEVEHLCFYWSKIDDPYYKTTKEILEGFAFSILVMIDGEHGSLPKFILAPDPCPKDKEYHIENDESYYPENYRSNVKCDIGGSLHGLFRKNRNKNE